MNADKTDFEKAHEKQRSSLVGEFFYLLMTNKKWWLLPILIVIALLALLSFFAGTGAAPFIYTIF